MARLNADAEPTPIIRESPTQQVVTGNATLVAAFPSSPILCPIKNWSTMLYNAPTIIAIILGIANFLRSVPILSVPNELLTFYVLLSLHHKE